MSPSFQYAGPGGEELTKHQQADYTRPLCAGVGPNEWSPPGGWSDGCAPLELPNTCYRNLSDTDEDGS